MIVFSFMLLLIVIVLFLFKFTRFIIIVIDKVLKVIFVFTTDVFERKGITQCHPEIRFPMNTN